MSKVTVSNIPQLGVLVIKQTDGKDFFISTNDSIIISVASLSFIISFLVKNGFMSYKVLEGILEDYHTDRGSGKDLDVS